LADVITVGDRTYVIRAVEHDGKWVARAEQRTSGDRFGTECEGATEEEATRRMASWLTWQHDHATALEALQRAEHDYHRAVAGSAFAGTEEGVELQKDALDRVETARVRLDEVRNRR
jgi:hypothetical protein